jgi:hypothetical protein
LDVSLGWLQGVLFAFPLLINFKAEGCMAGAIADGAAVFKLFGVIGLKGGDIAKKDLKALGEAGEKLSKTLNTVAKSANHLGTLLSKSFTAPLAVVGGAVGVLAVKTGQYANKLSELAQTTGLTTDSIQEYEHVARVAGVSSEGFLSVITKLSNSLPEIAQGSGSAAKALDQLGINVLDVNGNARDMNKLFPEIIRGLQGMENITERNALSQDIFGRSLKDIAPILGMSAEEMNNARTEAHKLGLVMDGKAIEGANNFRIGMDKLKAQFAAAGREIANGLIPILNEQFIPLIQSTIIPTVRFLAETFEKLMGVIDLLPGPLQKVVIGLGLMAAAAGPVVLIFGKLTLAVKGAIASLSLLYLNLKGLLIAAVTSAGAHIRGLIALIEGLGPAMGASTATIVASGAAIVAAFAAIGYALYVLKRDLDSLKKTKEIAAMGEQLQDNTKDAIKAAAEYRKLAGSAEYSAEKHLELEKALIKARIAEEDLIITSREHSKSLNSEQAAKKRAELAMKEAELMQKKERLIMGQAQMTEYAAAQLKKQQEEEAKAAKQRAKRSAEEARKRKEDLTKLLEHHQEAYDKMGKTEMELLTMEEAAEIKKARRLGATAEQLDTIINRYAAMREEMLDKDEKYWVEQGIEADKYLKERLQTERGYEYDLREAKRDIAIEGMTRDADDAESALKARHVKEMAEAKRQGGDTRALQIKQDEEMSKLRANNARSIAAAELDAKKEALQDQYAAEIEEAEKAFTDASAIRERYALEFENLEQQRVAAAKTADDEMTAITRDGNAARAALNKQYVQGFVSGMVSAANQLGSIMSQFSANDEKRLDRKYKEDKARIEANVSDETERAAQLAALDEEYEAKKLQVQKENAKREKALGIFNTVINTAQAIVKALADLGPIAGPIMAATVGALGVAQTVAIASTPEPFEAGALIQGGRGGVVGQIGEGKQDELILPMETGVDRLADRLIDALGNQVASSSGAAGGGNVTLNLGAFIGNDAGLRELERRLRPIRAAELKRTGDA